MTPIKRGTAKRLGLHRPNPWASWPRRFLIGTVSPEDHGALERWKVEPGPGWVWAVAPQ